MKPRLFLTFFRIGWIGFGGLGSVLALVEQAGEDRRGYPHITEALTYTNSCPARLWSKW